MRYNSFLHNQLCRINGAGTATSAEELYENIEGGLRKSGRLNKESHVRAFAFGAQNAIRRNGLLATVAYAASANRGIAKKGYTPYWALCQIALEAGVASKAVLNLEEPFRPECQSMGQSMGQMQMVLSALKALEQVAESKGGDRTCSERYF